MQFREFFIQSEVIHENNHAASVRIQRLSGREYFHHEMGQKHKGYMVAHSRFSPALATLQAKVLFHKAENFLDFPTIIVSFLHLPRTAHSVGINQPTGNLVGTVPVNQHAPVTRQFNLAKSAGKIGYCRLPSLENNDPVLPELTGKVNAEC